MKIFTFELGKIYPENRRKYACGPTPPLLTQFNLEGIAWQGRGASNGRGDGATGGRESGVLVCCGSLLNPHPHAVAGDAACCRCLVFDLKTPV